MGSCVLSSQQAPQQDDKPSPNNVFFFASFLLVFPTPSTSTPTMEQNFQPLGPLPKRAGYYDYDDYNNNMQGYEAYMQKRGGYCIGFGRSCSTKGITCCGEKICKCNLFRTNCRCQRSGIFGRR